MDSINQSVIDKLKSRAEVGEKKYGVTMERNDLTEVEWLQHAQCELMDGAVYLEKLIQLSRADSQPKANETLETVIEAHLRMFDKEMGGVMTEFEMAKLRQVLKLAVKAAYPVLVNEIETLPASDPLKQ